jgi:hypothetical protein
MNATTPTNSEHAKGPPPKKSAAETAEVPTLGAVTLDAIIAETEKRRLSLEPNDLDESWWLCERMAALNLHGVKTPEDALARIMTGRTIGLPAMQSIENIHLLWNKTSETWTTVMSVKAKLALVYRRKDVIEYVRMTASSPTTCTWVAKRRGEGEIEQSSTFTIADAEIAGLVGRGKDDAAKAMSNYSRHPAAMLQWRACGRLLDRVATDVLMGIATAEEVEDENSIAEQLRTLAEEVVATVVEKKLTLEEKLATGPVPTAFAKTLPVTRDWAAEAAVLKGQITAALETKDPELAKALKGAHKAFKDQAPEEWVQDVTTFYDLARGKPAPAATRKASPGPVASNPPAPAASPPPASPATPPATTPAATAPTPPAAAQVPCVSCGEFMPKEAQATWVPSANDGKGGWRHPECRNPVPTHDGKEPPPGALAGEAPATPAATAHPYLPPEQRGEDYEGPDTPPVPFG